MYWLGRCLDPVTLTYILRSSDSDTFYVDIQYLLNYKAYNHQTLHSASPQFTEFAGTLIGWPWPIVCALMTDTFYVNVHCLLNYKAYNLQILHSASSRCTDSVDVLTWWPWPIFLAAVTDTFYVDVRYLLNYKAYNLQTLHSASPQCSDFAGTLTWWPWPVFLTAVTSTHFMSTFGISSTIRPTTTKPCKVLHLDVLTWQVPWPGDLDLYFTLQWIWHIYRCSI